MDKDGVEYPYWSPDTCASKYLDDFPSTPQEPVGYTAKYTAYLVDNFTLVTGSNVSQWDDESVNANNLTQATSANQPTFNDDGVSVTQSTLANQPTFDYDKVVTQDTGANQPTLVDTGGGVLAVDFKDSNEALNNIPVNNSTEFSVEIDIKEDDTTGDRRLFNSQTQSESIKASGASYYNVRFSDNASVNLFHNSDVTQRNKVKFVTNGTDIKLYMNDVLEDTKSAIGKVLDINAIGATSFSMRGSVYSVRLWNSADSSGTPDFELLPDPATMRKTDGTQPVAGDSVQGWWATGAQLAVGFDGSFELLDGLHRKSGDISYEIIFKHNNININQYLRGNGDSNAYFYYDGSAFKLAGDGRTSVLSYSATLSTNTTYKVEIIKNGLNVELILDDISLGTQSTSDEFIFDQIGYNTNPQNIDGCVFSFRQWNSADSSGTPDFELLPDVQYIPSGVGQPVPTWYATQHNQYANTVNFDATDDNMTPLPTTSLKYFQPIRSCIRCRDSVYF
jgi:hypothetical protein